FELEAFALPVHRELAGEVAAPDGRRHVGDVADLRREVAGHLVHGFGQFFPDAGGVLYLRLTTQFPFRADLAGDARHLRGEHGELIDHLVDELGRTEELAFEGAAIDLEAHLLAEVAFGDGADGARDLDRGPEQIVDQCVQRDQFIRSRAHHADQARTFLDPAFFAHHAADPRDFAGPADAVRGDLIEDVGDTALDTRQSRGQAHREVAVAKIEQRREQLTRESVAFVAWNARVAGYALVRIRHRRNSSITGATDQPRTTRGITRKSEIVVSLQVELWKELP